MCVPAYIFTCTIAIIVSAHAVWYQPTKEKLDYLMLFTFCYNNKTL